jgi:hypothetical protein
MRKAFAIAVISALTLSIQAAPASAEGAERYRYETTWVNVFWHSRERVDQDTYRRITWYAGAYDSGEDGFWSDLYRSVSECEEGDGRDRCRYVRRLSWWGVTGRGSFTIDGQLESSQLEVSYRLYQTRNGERERIGRFTIVTDVMGRGELATGRSSYTYREGCTMYRSNGRWASRQATATGTLARGGHDPSNLGKTDDAAIGTNEDLSISHEC